MKLILKQILLSIFLIIFTIKLHAQEKKMAKVNIPNEQAYQFTPVIDIEASPVKNQGITGTCWSFSTSSFLESEIYKNSNKNIDISEMYTVRNTYLDKAWNYVMRQGKAQFDEGGLAHDVINTIKSNGMVPESAYSGMEMGATKYDHSKLVSELKPILDAYIKNGKISAYPNWKMSVDSVLDIHFGKIPETFMFEDKVFTPHTFYEMTKLNTNDYVTFTSFLQHPFYSNFILNIPDNFSNGSFYNIPLNSLVEAVDNSLQNGYTVALDCDVSEKTFSQKYGLAVRPKNVSENGKSMNFIVEEAEILPELRQEEFENFNTTDDHLMHIVGLVKDQNDTVYYKVKNSWGDSGNGIGNNGYIYMSKPYFRLKTISVLINKNALSEDLKEKLKL